ncbi:hypothetical protein ACFLU6_04430 [Acidobacteriota bacterium]
MKYRLEEIAALIAAATQEEQKELAALLDYDLSDLGDAAKKKDVVGYTLAKHLWWEYQTPLGWLVKKPSFDDICVDIAKRLKLQGLTGPKTDCWHLLSSIVRNLTEKMLDEMDADQKKEFVKKFLTDDEYKRFMKHKKIDYAKVGSGTLFIAMTKFGGLATYSFAIIAANQVSRILLGKGLSWAANAVLVRTVPLLMGPVGWLLFLWGFNDLMGTNYKRVIPASFYIYSIYERLKAKKSLPF